MYELAIVGGGPAGMTAAVYAARKKLNTLIISKDVGGQVNWTSGVENYMGYQIIEGPELMQKFEEQVKQFPIDVKIGQTVNRISRAGKKFEIETADGEKYQTKAVLLASGKRPRPLNVAGEERLIGRGVTYCAICDGPVFAGEKVAIIGGGNSALESADDMVKIAEHIYLVSVTPLTGDAVLIDKVKAAKNITIFLEHEVLEIIGEKRVTGIKIRDTNSKEVKTMEVGGVFIEIGLIPNSMPVRDTVKLNQWGEVEVNYFNDTSVPGLFAAGDVTNVPEKQIVIAAGEGAKAALRAHRYLQRLKE